MIGYNQEDEGVLGHYLDWANFLNTDIPFRQLVGKDPAVTGCCANKDGGQSIQSKVKHCSILHFDIMLKSCLNYFQFWCAQFKKKILIIITQYFLHC